MISAGLDIDRILYFVFYDKILKIYLQHWVMKFYRHILSKYRQISKKCVWQRFHIKTPFTIWKMCTWYMWIACLQTFRSNRICWKLAYFLRNLQTSRTNNLRILMIKHAKFSGFCFYRKANIYEDFQICISVPLRYEWELEIEIHSIKKFHALVSSTGWKTVKQ